MQRHRIRIAQCNVESRFSLGGAASAALLAAATALVLTGCAKPEPGLPPAADLSADPAAVDSEPVDDRPIVGPIETRKLEFEIGGQWRSATLVAHAIDVRRPVLVLLHDEAGLDEWMMARADAFARMGYIVVAPELTSASALMGRDLSVPPMIDAAVAAALDSLHIQTEAAPPRIGAIGYGPGASHALTLAEMLELEMIIMVGGQLRASEEALLDVREPVLGILGALDPQTPMELIERFDEALRHTGGLASLQVWSDEGANFLRSPADPSNAPQAQLEIVRWLDTYLPIRTGQ